ncbi:MAG: thiamine diphosphokinase [Armatimonadetes bacterium]|nr:thiamine diphosphokinase [Armatimonadota bacterium]
MPRVLILANGEPPAAELLRRRAGEAAGLVCTDGAAAAALDAGLTPDLVVGDLDSLDDATRARLGGVEVRGLVEQETTDLEKAIYTLLARGVDEVLVLGAGGRRWDQFHANLSLFARYAHRLTIRAEDDWGRLTMATPGATTAIGEPLGAVVSLLPLPSAEAVSTAGLRWPLVNARLALGGRLGVSNEVIDERASVTFGSGGLAIYVVNTRHRPA